MRCLNFSSLPWDKRYFSFPRNVLEVAYFHIFAETNTADCSCGGNWLLHLILVVGGAGCGLLTTPSSSYTSSWKKPFVMVVKRKRQKFNLARKKKKGGVILLLLPFHPDYYSYSLSRVKAKFTERYSRENW